MLQTYVLGVSDVSLIYVAMFHKDVVKVYRDMLQWLYTYVASFCSQCVSSVFQMYVQVCLFGCCICFTHILQVFYLDVTYVLQWF
jgi:hypothetical protein